MQPQPGANGQCRSRYNNHLADEYNNTVWKRIRSRWNDSQLCMDKSKRSNNVYTGQHQCSDNRIIQSCTGNVYVFRLTITDNSGATATDNVTVTVNAALPTGNQPPTARTENDITITLPVNTAQLHGNTSSDPDGVISTYQWTQVSGPSASVITNGATSVATVSDLTTGIYTFELKVTDDDGATSTKTIKVTVNNKPGQGALMKVYPNPTAGILNIQYVSNSNGKYKVMIYDANRKLVRSEVMDKTQISITKTIDVSIYERGVYFIQFISPENETMTKQFVKM